MADALLKVERLAKRFGGIVATDDVDISVPEGELHAVIGPNGAGMTTRISQLSGTLSADAGRIRFAGADITRAPARRRSHLGLARSFQITSLFLDLTVLDNVALAVQAHAGHSFHFWRNARREERLRQPARAALEQVGLAHRADVRASLISHGEHRLLELAMALAGQPRMLLLDEPMAGLGPDESARMVETLRGLKRRYTILLVEHDMEAVFALAARITELVYGRVIASGAPDAIRGLPAYKVAQAGIGLVPEGRQIFPNLTVRENLVATAACEGEWTLERVHELFPRLSERAGSMGN